MEFRLFTKLGIRTDGLRYLEVAIFDGPALIANLDFDQSWFDISQLKIEEYITPEEFRKTLPGNWLEIVLKRKNDEMDDPIYGYVISKPGGDVVLSHVPDSKERSMLLGG